MTQHKELLIQARDAIEKLQKKMMPQVNGADMSCFTIGMRQQVTEGEMHQMNCLRDDLQAAIDAPEDEPIGYIAWRDGEPAWGEDCVCRDTVYPCGDDDDRTSMAIYTHPAPAKPLTDSEAKDLCKREVGCTALELVRAIEAAHGIGVVPMKPEVTYKHVAWGYDAATGNIGPLPAKE